MTDGEPEFRARLDAAAADTDALLDELLSEHREHGELQRPARLLEAMRYAALGGGKRLRPFLVLETSALFGVPRGHALRAGAALECVHCYSLVHDDLPAMDNDDLRRGQPTTHKAFDEATAILAGDALLTFAFDVLARDEVHPNAAVRVALIQALARAAGIGGMAGGQMLDLAAEGRFGPRRTPAAADIATLQAMKTGALIEYACRAGAMLGEAGTEAASALARYGRAIGEAFQIADDLIDLESDSVTAGKTTGKDAAAGKATLVATLGRDAARARLSTLTDEAALALGALPQDTSVLSAAARFIAGRRK
ncbi:MAG: (2E,6E)-farnesyl diphosphate synthase [Pseudolabrys sp.]|nr:(2E,6E)-farnesyl diphosphate synthase [Pseudolabrys sp.]